MKYLIFTLILLLNISISFAESSEYCWVKTKPNSIYIEFPCAYTEDYDFQWFGGSVYNDYQTNTNTHENSVENLRNVAQGDGYLVFVRKSDSYSTGKIKATFQRGILTSDINNELSFYKCINADCNKFEYKLSSGSQLFIGSLIFSDNSKLNVLSIDNGILVDSDSYYIGNFIDNRANGNGRLCFGNTQNIDLLNLALNNNCPFPLSYLAGEWNNGSFVSGQARSINSDGSIYEGFIDNGTPNKIGKYLWADGSIYEGEFYYGKRQGFGIYYYPDGSVYNGMWENNIKEGYGELFLKTINAQYYGSFKNGEMNGHGILYFNNNMVFIGEFSNNVPDGQGALIIEDKSYIAVFYQGKLVSLSPDKTTSSISWSDFNPFVSTAHAGFFSCLGSPIECVNKGIKLVKKAAKKIIENPVVVANMIIGCIHGAIGGVGAGFVSGAATGAGVGAGIGVVSGGVGAVPGAIAGAATGAVAGAEAGAVSGCFNQISKQWEKNSNTLINSKEVLEIIKEEFNVENFVVGGIAGALPGLSKIISKLGSAVFTKIISKTPVVKKIIKKVEKILDDIYSKYKKRKKEFFEEREKASKNKPFNDSSNNKKKPGKLRTTKKEKEIYDKAGTSPPKQKTIITSDGKKVTYKVREQKIDGKKKNFNKETGKIETNCDLMKRGSPPYANDGSKINLHHNMQADVSTKNESYFVELSAKQHSDNYQDLHFRDPKSDNESKFFNNVLRPQHWKLRAKEICK